MMNFFHPYLVRALGFALCLLLCSRHSLALEAPVRILPLGDSLTFGEANSSAQGGYRNRLYNLLTGAGFNVDFIGTFSDTDNPTLPDVDHQGAPSYRTDQIQANIDEWLDEVEDPDVVLLLIGTNDLWQNFLYPGQFPLSQTEDNLAELIATIGTRRPFAKIIVSNLPKRIDFPAIEVDQVTFNLALPDIVAQQVSLGHQVSLLDMHPVLTVPGDYSDGVHPSTAGYEKMADAWYKAIADPVNGVITPQGTSNPPVIARVGEFEDLSHVSLVFSKPVADTAATPTNFSISGGLTVTGAVLDTATKRTVTLTTSPQSPGFEYTISVSDVKDRTPQQTLIASESMISFARNSVLNGSFEDGYAGWTATGNSEIQTDGVYGYESTDGTYLVSFNSGTEDPGGSLSQSITTIVGRTYRLAFDYGISAHKKNLPQQLEVTIQGAGPPVSDQYIVQSSVNYYTVNWLAEEILFTADSTSTTVTFTDQSTIADSLLNDLLLDNIRVEPQPPTTLAITSSQISGVNMTVSQPDIDSNGSGTTGMLRYYNPGTSVTVTAPASIPGADFQHWRKNGVDFPTSGNSIELIMNASIALDAVYDPDTIAPPPDFELWLDGFGLTAGPSEDSDGDSISNAVEYVIGGNPANQPDNARLPVMEMANEDPDGDLTASDYLRFTYRRTDQANVDPAISIAVEWSTDLAGPWTVSTDTPGSLTIADDDPEETGVDEVRVYIPESLAPEGRLFARLRITVSSP